MLGIAERQNEVLSRFNQPTPTAPVAPVQPAQLADDDYVTGSAMRTFAEQYAARPNPDLARSFEMIAEANLEQVKRNRPSDFAKYGPEIIANLANLSDKRQWSIDNLTKVVKFTLVDHVDDLARERATQIATEMGSTLRSTGAGGFPINQPNAGNTLDSEKLPSEWKERAAKVGLTEAALDEFCRANDMSRDDWFKLFGSSAIAEGTHR